VIGCEQRHRIGGQVEPLATEMIRDYDFHPPDEVRLFPMPTPGVLHLDERIFVAVVRYGDIVLWHYAFADRWFKINATTDLHGGLVETAATNDVPPFAFNCDIATPMGRRGDVVLAVDLFLDVLVRSDGVTYGVHDRQALDNAIRRGWVSEREAAGAREGLAELLGLIQADRLVAFLAEAHPFTPIDAPAAPAMQSVPLRQVPLLQPGLRPWW
jgi:hypothetical protein